MVVKNAALAAAVVPRGDEKVPDGCLPPTAYCLEGVVGGT